MPEKPKVIFENKECPICHCTETVSQIAAKPLKEAGKIGKDVFTSLSQLRMPMLDPRTAIASVPTLIVYVDGCAKCGFPYYTKAETALIPVVAQQASPPTGMGFKSS